MLEFVRAGGWVMVPILFCSVLAMAIVVERYWSLRRAKVAPPRLASEVWQALQAGKLSDARLLEIQKGSALGRIFAAALAGQSTDRDTMKERVEDVGRHVVHELERYLSALGTIAAITPLLGLLGTVIGMIKVFTVITAQGVGDPSILADGIKEALFTTAGGLGVAIPALIFYRHFQARVDSLVLSMEQDALRLVEAVHSKSAARGKAS